MLTCCQDPGFWVSNRVTLRVVRAGRVAKIQPNLEPGWVGLTPPPDLTRPINKSDQKYDHTVKVCQNTQKCRVCATSEHNNYNCLFKSSLSAHCCINCNLEHAA